MKVTRSNNTRSTDSPAKAMKFINVALPENVIEDLHHLKISMGLKTQAQLITRMTAIIKAIESACRA